MKAMILAAGKGTRVWPLTYELPKPMIPILGKPVLKYLIEHLARRGVRKIMINVSYQHEKIEQYFGDGNRFGVKIGYSFEGAIVDGVVVPQPVGSAGGLRKIHDFSGFFDETTLVLYGDAVIDLNLGAALLEHRQRGAQASLVVQLHVGEDCGRQKSRDARKDDLDQEILADKAFVPARNAINNTAMRPG